MPCEAGLKRFSQQLDAHLKKPKAYAKKKRVLKALNRVALAMLAVIVIYCLPAWRPCRQLESGC